MLGYATPNDASANATFLFDDIEQINPNLSNTDFLLNNQNEVISYPNPAKENITISSTKENITNISIYNLLGREVFTIKPNNFEQNIDVSRFSKGIYIAKVSTLKGWTNLKLLIE
jgi:hypothetical protein